jgi:heme A synthase
MLYPVLWHAMVAKFLDDNIIALARYLWVGIASLHRWKTRSHARKLIVLLALLLYLIHTLGIVLLTCRYVIAIVTIHIAELALTETACHSLVAYEITLSLPSLLLESEAFYLVKK